MPNAECQMINGGWSNDEWNGECECRTLTERTEECRLRHSPFGIRHSAFGIESIQLHVVALVV
jgi:hypothetical protein